MINAYNLTEQTLDNDDYITFDGYNFGGNRWCNTSQKSMTITKTGTYEIEGVVNASPSVAGQMQFNLMRNGTEIPGGYIYMAGSTVDIIENGTAKVTVNAFAGTTFGIKNNTEDAVTIPANSASLSIKRVA